jgi:hypothetical protein
VITGFEVARGEGVCVVMADLSDDLALLPRMEAMMRDGIDLVSPSRYMPGGRQIGGPWLKRVLSRLAGTTLHSLAAVPTHDPTNNFKLYRRSMLAAIPVGLEGGFELALEITVKSWRAGYRVGVAGDLAHRTRTVRSVSGLAPALPGLVPARFWPGREAGTGAAGGVRRDHRRSVAAARLSMIRAPADACAGSTPRRRQAVRDRAAHRHFPGSRKT